jgi:hypothetical protein
VSQLPPKPHPAQQQRVLSALVLPTAVAKMVPSVFLLVLALEVGNRSKYACRLAAGLVCSTAGGGLLQSAASPEDPQFTNSLYALLLGHLFYIAAFMSNRFKIHFLTVAPVLAAAIGVRHNKTNHSPLPDANTARRARVLTFERNTLRPPGISCARLPSPCQYVVLGLRLLQYPWLDGCAGVQPKGRFSEQGWHRLTAFKRCEPV